MNLAAIFGIIAGILQVISVVPYVWSMVYGTTRPNAASYFVWAVLGVIVVFAQLSVGASWSLVLFIVIAGNTSLEFFLAFFKYGYGKYGWIDFSCLFLGLAAIVLWQLTGNPIVGITLTVMAYVLAGIPTIVKTYKDPDSELAFAWLLTTAAALLSVLSVTKINTANLIFPAYLLLESGLITGFAFFGQRRKKALK